MSVTSTTSFEQNIKDIAKAEVWKWARELSEHLMNMASDEMEMAEEAQRNNDQNATQRHCAVARSISKTAVVIMKSAGSNNSSHLRTTEGRT